MVDECAWDCCSGTLVLANGFVLGHGHHHCASASQKHQSGSELPDSGVTDGVLSGFHGCPDSKWYTLAYSFTVRVTLTICP